MKGKKKRVQGVHIQFHLPIATADRMKAVAKQTEQELTPWIRGIVMQAVIAAEREQATNGNKLSAVG